MRNVYFYSMDAKKEKNSAWQSTKKAVTSYDYFAICHSFVDQMKKFNELRKLKTAKPV